jgi:uncharacterized protein RhaS with RHS repeats
MYMRNRYYDPATGQFTQTDPIGLGGRLNTYGFAAGDPVSYRDPYGLDCEDADGNRVPCEPTAARAGPAAERRARRARARMARLRRRCPA